MASGPGQQPDASLPGDQAGAVREAADGLPGDPDQLLPLVYSHLRAIAQQRMTAERPGHTLQATALVHEAYARIAGDRPEGWTNPGQFYAVAAEAMRRILIEHARSRGRVKRGGGRQRALLNVLDLAAEADAGEIVSLDAAIRRLEDRDTRAAEVVRLRFFAGLTIERTASAMGLSAPTVKRSWEFARAFLYRALEEETAKDSTADE